MSLRGYTRALINGGWMVTCFQHHARFRAALEQVASVQRQYLFGLLKRNADTCFGAEHGFARIRSISEYQERVPITSYEDLGGAIEAIARGESGVLTSGPVKLFQPTSGSSSATKLIPWTASLAGEFRRGIAPWVFHLYRRKPALLRGTAYWSVSPPVVAHRMQGRLRVGFDDDAQYLGFLGRKLFSLVSAVSPGGGLCQQIEEFRTQTILSLLADEDLSLVSVWSPTFLTALLEEFLRRDVEFVDLLEYHANPAARRRADLVRSAIRASGKECFEMIWPKLQLISCWADGPSALYASNLRQFFPRVEIQGKGLVATEAFVSLPYFEDRNPVLAATSHFFEFQDLVSERILLAHELSRGGTYRVIVSTGGGLYRYSLGDLVCVTGFINTAPCLRFVGREGNLSDLFGEKLNGVFVDQVVRRVLAQHAVKTTFFLLAPVTDGPKEPCYTLFLEAEEIPDAAGLRHSLERGLAENFHYAHCRNLGQLGEVRVFLVAPVSASAEVVFQQAMLARGLKLGNIKMVPLDCQPGWERRFSGRYLN